MSPIITIALPIFAIIAVGAFAGRRGVLSAADAGALNRFVFNFAMPTALFGLTATADPIAADDAVFAAGYGLAAMIVIFGSYAVARLVFALDPIAAGAHAFASTLGNAVFLGLPIALSVPGWANAFVILMLVEGILVIAVGAALMSPRAGFSVEIVLRPLRNPLVAAMAAGLIFSLVANAIGLSPPTPATRFLEIFGRAAGPTALFSLGLFLATHPIAALRPIAGKVGAIIAFKMAALPALTLAFMALLGVSAPDRIGPAALFTLVPVGVGAYVMASGVGRYETEAAAAVAVSTAISLLTISAVLAQFA
ncbi:MAG: AEC family transporter [Pseudomonadota bacterium]